MRITIYRDMLICRQINIVAVICDFASPALETVLVSTFPDVSMGSVEWADDGRMVTRIGLHVDTQKPLFMGGGDIWQVFRNNDTRNLAKKASGISYW